MTFKEHQQYFESQLAVRAHRLSDVVNSIWNDGLFTRDDVEWVARELLLMLEK